MRLAVALLALLLAAAPARAESVEAGPLRADVAADPWALSFSGPGMTLAEDAATRLGFRSGGHGATALLRSVGRDEHPEAAVKQGQCRS